MLDAPACPSDRAVAFSRSKAAPLSEHAVDVWWVDLDRAPDELGQLLTPAERERAAHIVGERRRERWVLARGTLRALLGSYLGQDPRTLALETDAHGKPALPGGPSFNLSHSAGLALYAFTHGAPVGVDVERIDLAAHRDDVALAARMLSPDIARRLAEIGDLRARREEFLREWVRYEAQLKCLGMGLAGAKRTAAAQTAIAGAPAGTDTPTENRSLPWIAELDVGPRARAAVAVAGASRAIRYWEYSKTVT